MRSLLTNAIALALFCCAGPSPREPNQPEAKKWIDLTYPFDSTTIYWPTSAKFKMDTVFHGNTPDGYFYSAYAFCTAEHGGTHLDAPIHFARGKNSVDQIPLEQLTGMAAVIDFSAKALDNPDYQLSPQELRDWEAKHGPIPEGSIVLLRSGYGKFWPNKLQYMGTSKTGSEGVANLHFPGLHPDAARWLVKNRSIKAIGIDTPSIDYGQSSLFESHQILFAENIPAFENVANLDLLPPTGANIVAFPMNIKNGSGAPLRIAAWVNG